MAIGGNTALDPFRAPAINLQREGSLAFRDRSAWPIGGPTWSDNHAANTRSPSAISPPPWPRSGRPAKPATTTSGGSAPRGTSPKPSPTPSASQPSPSASTATTMAPSSTGRRPSWWRPRPWSGTGPAPGKPTTSEPSPSHPTSSSTQSCPRTPSGPDGAPTSHPPVPSPHRYQAGRRSLPNPAPHRYHALVSGPRTTPPTSAQVGD